MFNKKKENMKIFKPTPIILQKRKKKGESHLLPLGVGQVKVYK